MNPKEKANELVGKYKSLTWQSGNYKRSLKSGITHYGVSKASQRQMTMEAAKQCALIAVEEILKALHKADTAYDMISQIEYWNDVKTEIEKL